MEKKEKTRRKRLAILILPPLLITVIFLLFIIYTLVNPPQTVYYDIYLTVGNYTGFNVATDALYFGTVPEGGSASRFIEIKNEGDRKLESSLIFEGNVTAFLSAGSKVVLEPYQNMTVRITASVPPDAPRGEYFGKVYVVSRLVQ